ncbi:MAG: GNAT family N-acetyltransferase [Phycisphaeraceae bacterium]
MPHSITRITAREFDELIAFLDVAFGHDTPERSFVHLLPASYQPDEAHCRCNYALRVEGKLAAVVGLFPIEWHLGGETLRVAGIGGVAVGHDFRRRGLMNQLMTHVRQEIIQAGYPLSYLAGQRQRYRYFGWEVAGTQVVADIDQTNLKHTFGDAQPAVTLDLHPDPRELQALQVAQFDHCRRADFAVTVRNWRCHPVAARDRAGRLVAYAVVSGDGQRVTELVATDAESSVQMVRAIMRGSEACSVRVLLGSTQLDAIGVLSHLAERVSVESTGNWQIFDWPRTIGLLMRASHALSPLPHGQVTLRADGQVFRMTVDASGPRCESCTTPPDLALDGPTMTRLLFGPLQPPAVSSKSPSILSAWCPLPLGLSGPDHV